MKPENVSNKIARIENKFIFHAQYKFTSREQKVILYLIANINPKQERFIEQIMPVRELEQVLKSDGKKWGGLYEEMRRFAKRIRTKGIEFDTNVLIDGRRFPAYINWFQSVVPVQREDGEICIRFLFSQDLEPFLLSLNQYAKINRLEIAPMKSGFSIRMFQIFRAHRDRMAKHEDVSRLKYEVEGLKNLLGISGSYAEFRDFNKRVLNVVKREVNENSSILVIDIEKQRNSKRRITHITFVFRDQETEHSQTSVLPPKTSSPVKSTYGDYLPSADEVGSLTKAQLDAYNHLVDFGVKEGIAFRQMILKIKGSEANGFEDWYIQEAIKIFKTKTTLKSKNAQAGAFVKWYLEGKVFEEGSYFGQIMERISKQKKRLSAEQWRNRKTAMTINAEQFNALHSKTNIEKVQPKSKTKPKPIIKSKQGSQSLIDIIDLSSPEGKWSKPFNFKTFQKEFESDYEGIKTAAEQEMEDFFIDMERPANYNDILLNAIKIRCEHWYNQQQ
jgi:hypothetical protein